MKRLILFIALLPLSARAGRPSWTNHPPSDDGTYKYYLGISTSADSQVDANFQATTDARRKAISANFGVFVNFKSESYRSTQSLSATQTAQEISGGVMLVGFEPKDSYFEDEDGKVTAWILFQFPKDEILKEKERLKGLRDKQGESFFQMNEFGSEKGDNHGGTLEVRSHPEGLPVKFDSYSDMFGKPLTTPLRVHGVEVGRHLIVIDHPKYSYHREEVEVMPGTTASVDAVMKPAAANLKIITNPDQATVSIGSATYKSPTDYISIPAGVPVLVQINHPEAKKSVQEEITLNRNDKEDRSFTLELKPARISINSIPEKAGVFVDGKNSDQETPAVVVVSPRKGHTLKLKREHYEDWEQSVDSIPGGGNRILPDADLVKIDEEERKLAEKEAERERQRRLATIAEEKAERRREEQEERQSERERLVNPPWIFAGYYGLSTSPMASPDYPLNSTGVRLQYKFLHRLGVEADLFYGFSSAKYSDANAGTSAFGAMVGLPIFLGDTIFLAPEIGILNTQISVSYSSGTNSGQGVTQQVAGAILGWNCWFNRNPEAMFRWGMVLDVGLLKFYRTTGGLTGSLMPIFKTGLVFGVPTL